MNGINAPLPVPPPTLITYQTPRTRDERRRQFEQEREGEPSDDETDANELNDNGNASQDGVEKVDDSNRKGSHIDIQI